MATIRITNLRLRTIIGIYDWERETEQDVVINVAMEVDGQKAARSDDLNDSIDYKEICKKVISHVKTSRYFLIEKLCGSILDIVLENPLVEEATVRVDKPHALRFADSVSVELTRNRISP